MGTTSKKNDVYREIEQNLGLVPGWMRNMPNAALGGFWSLMRDFSLAETTIPSKYKELIGLGVAGATRCKYCTLFHTEGARLHGATAEEIAESAMMASITMTGSTYLNAQQVDYETFRKETQSIVAFAKAHMPQSSANHTARGRH